MRQLNNKQFDTKEGASASLSELSHPQLAPSVSQKDEIMKNNNKWNEVYHIDNQCDVPPFFLANKLREMGFSANVYVGISSTNVWSNCGDSIAKTLLDLVHNHISYDEIDDYAECDIYEEIGHLSANHYDMKGGK